MNKRQRKKAMKKLLACDEFWAEFEKMIPIVWERPDPLIALLNNNPIKITVYARGTGTFTRGFVEWREGEAPIVFLFPWPVPKEPTPGPPPLVWAT